MRVISKKPLIDFGVKHPPAMQPLMAWHDEALKTTWSTPQDIKNQYRSASFVGRNRVVFNIKGNDYRLIASISYRVGAVYIKFVGTHTEYDAVDAVIVEI